ncbi:DUF4097 family beta strand repeat-containing protein [Pontibacter cellulosilyticus]|uniref:Adhesin domain-containing protein n=1 Tax=Pontibacter cellulosilyticus TaxID=1720253 RepID=A0A923SJL5_9BACT|nr:hypothetical protein [Pontibacter cellulosilyticus]MBC5993953.1 hypothetical protein [Pontibacter cellulosilyticus]
MKRLTLLLICWLLLLGMVQAQPKTVEKTLKVPANKRVDLQLKFGDNIKITAWDKKEASVKVTYEVNGGKLNDALLLNFDEDQESARVKVDFDKELMKNGKAEDCPDSKGYSTYSDGSRSYTCSTINYEIFVPRDADLTVETINGDIEIRGVTGPVAAKSISGFVDMNWAAKKGAGVSLKTITGEVYTDMDIAFANKKEKTPLVGYELNGTLNGGGTDIKLESISNNVYFRKQN